MRGFPLLPSVPSNAVARSPPAETSRSSASRGLPSSWPWVAQRRPRSRRRALKEGAEEEVAEKKGTQQGRFERALLQAWHKCASPRPEVKEIKECLAFHRCTRRLLGENTLLVDAAGGHGGIALAFLASGKVKQAVVADIYQPRGYSNLRAAWAPDALIEHRCVDLRVEGWLQQLLVETGIDAAETAVTACHACGVLTDELIRECLRAQVSFAIVPCCHGEKAGSEPFITLHAALSLGREPGAKCCASLPRPTLASSFTPCSQLLDTCPSQDFKLDRSITYDLLRLGAIDAAPGYVAPA